uniref:Ovule protein n=1 Tax=Romanomermis culicivorax TaxID=13658 RepID=A0A915KUF3_ROMCU
MKNQGIGICWENFILMVGEFYFDSNFFLQQFVVTINFHIIEECRSFVVHIASYYVGVQSATIQT